jgi:glutathione S-transferase
MKAGRATSAGAIAAIAAVPFGKLIEEEIAPDEVTDGKHPLVTEWWSRMQARPAFRRAKIGPFTDRPVASTA